MAKILGSLKLVDSPRYGNIVAAEVRCPHCGGIATVLNERTRCSTFEAYLKSIQGRIVYCQENPKCFDKPIIIQGKWANRYEEEQTDSGIYQAASGL
jgi:hypothetical protein